MAPHSSTLAWKIPWTEEPGRLQSMGSLGVGYDWATSLSLSCIGEGNGNPLQSSCLESPRDRGAWWAAVYGVTQSRTRLKWLSSSSSKIQTHTEGRGKKRTGLWRKQSTNQRKSHLQTKEKGFRKTLLTPWSWISNLQYYKEINSCLNHPVSNTLLWQIKQINIASVLNKLILPLLSHKLLLYQPTHSSLG